MAKRRKPYEGGAWSIGSAQPYRAPGTLTRAEAEERRQEVIAHWLPIARERAAAGRAWYSGIVAFYLDELAQLDAVITAQTAPAQKRRPRRRTPERRPAPAAAAV